MDIVLRVRNVLSNFISYIGRSKRQVRHNTIVEGVVFHFILKCLIQSARLLKEMFMAEHLTSKIGVLTEHELFVAILETVRPGYVRSRRLRGILYIFQQIVCPLK